MSSSSSRAFRRARAGALAAGLVASAAGALIFGHAQDAQADYATDCASPTQTYTTANPAPLNLTVNPGDVFLFASGTYTGNVDANGGTICVAAGVTFSPGSVNGSPRVFNRGTAVFPGLAAGNNSLFDNEGTATFNPVPNTNGFTTVVNRAGALLTVNSSFSLGPGASTTNFGTTIIHGGLNMNGATLVNNGTTTIEGDLNVSGSYTNNAQATVTGLLTVNGNGELSNACSLAANGMINDKTVSNTGIIHLLPGGLLNNGGATFSQANIALTHGGEFTNTGLVNGAGQYLFTGASSNIGSGTFAGGSAADPIVFFDASLIGGPIFDTETGTHTNTVRQEVEVPPVGACNVEPPTPPTTTTTASTTTAPTTTAPTTTAPTTTTTPETTTTDGATTTTGVSTTTTAGATTTTMDPTTSTAGATTTTGDVEAVTVSSSDPAADDTLPHTGSSWPARGLPGALLFIAVGAASVMATRRRSVR